MKSTNFTLDIIAALNKQLTKKQLKNDLKSLDDSLSVKILAKLTTALSKQQLKKDLKQLNDLYVQVGANVNVDKDTKNQLQKRIKELQNTISDIEVNLKVSKSKVSSEVETARKTVQTKANKAPIGFDIEVKRSKAIADIEYLGKRFSKLFTNAAASQKYENILSSAYSISDEKQLRSVRNQIAAFTSELKANGLASQRLGDKWQNLIDRSKDLFSAASIITVIFSQVKQAVSTFLQLDTAMTNLYKTQGQITSRDQFSGLLTKWNKLAQNLAVTTESLINSAAEWSKIGFNLDMSEQLAQITAIFEKAAEISTEKATSTLISAAQAFTQIGDLGVDDYVARVEAIGDRINAIGNKYSISSEGIASGLQNASAALKVAGNDLDETISLITATNKIFQSPEETSNMLKVVSMRLRGQVDALKEMGEDAEGLSTDITKIQQQIYELTGNRVNIFEDEDTLKSTYQMVLEIGEVFDSLNDRQQADLLETMFGKRRASAGASLLLNYEELEKIKNDSINAANSMAEEYSKYMESAEAHITIFKEKLVETYSTFMSGDLIKYTADVGNGILDLVNSTDLLKHGILAVLALNVSNGITSFGTAIATTVKQMNTLGGALQQVKNLPIDDVLRVDKLEELGNSTKSLTEKNLKLLLSQKNLDDSDRIRILKMHNLSDEEAQLKLEKMGLITTTNAQSAANVTETTTTFTLKNAMTSLKASIIGVGTSIKAAFLSNPLGFVLTGITTIISVATTLISNHNQKLEEMHERAKEAADSANTLGDEIAELASKYISLSEAVKTDESAKEDLISTQSELLKKLGLEGEGIDALIAKYGSLSKAIKQASIDSLKETQIDLIAGVDAAREDLLSASKDNFWGSKNIISTTGEDAVKAFEELEKAGIVGRGAYGSGGGALVLTGDDKTVDGALENFKRLEDAVHALRDSEAFTAAELSENSLFQAIYGRYSEMKEGVEEYKSAIGDLNENLSQQTMLTALQGRELPKTEEDFNTFKQELIDTAIASEQFIGNEKEIAFAINSYLATVPDFEGFYSVPLENELGRVKDLVSDTDTPSSISDIFSLKDAEGTLTNLGQISESIDTIQNAYKTLNNAIDEYNKNGTFSIDTLQSVIALGDDWLDYLVDEEGNLTLDKESLERLTVARLNDMRVQAINNVIDNVSKIHDEITANEYLASTNYALADSYETVAAAELDAARARMANAVAAGTLSQENMDAAMKKATADIDKINKLFDNTNIGVDSIMGGGSSGGSASKSEFSETIDFFERRVEVLDDALSHLKSTLDNVAGSFGKNNLIDAELGINEEKFNNYTDALAMYTQKANEAFSKLPADIASKVKDGAVALTDFIGDSNKDVVNAIKEYESWTDKISDCTKELEELKAAIRQLELEKFNNIMDDFSNQFNLRGDSKDLITKQIDLLKGAGELIGESFFTAQIDQSKKQLELLENEKAQLINQMSSAVGSGRIQKGTNEWLEMVNALSDVDSSILECKKSIEEFDNSILELHTEVFNRIQEQFSDLDSEISNIIDLFDDFEVSDDKGIWSKESIAQLGLLAQQYELAQYRVQQYNNEIDELNAQYLSGRYSATEYADRLAELNSAQWDAVKSTESAKDAIMDLNETRIENQIKGIEKEIDAYRELTDAQIEALKASKDLHDYENSIANKTKAITDLEHQIAAMQNDNTAATVAKRKQLEEQLAEAKSDLEETEYQHSIEVQEDALNKQYEQYEKERNDEIDALRESLNDRETILAESFETVKNNAVLVGQEIVTIATEHGITVSNALIFSWQSGENAIASYGKVLSQNTSAFIQNIIGVENEVWNLQAQANTTADSLAWMFSTKADNLVNELHMSYYAETTLADMTNALQQSLVNTLEHGYDVSGIVNSLNAITESANRAKAAISAADAAKAALEITNATIPDKNKNLSAGMSAAIIAGNIGTVKKYASGTRNAEDGLRIVNEEGSELELPRLSSGNYAVGNAGDQILTKAETDNIFEWSKFDPKDFTPVNMAEHMDNLRAMSMPAILPNNVNNNSVNNYYDSMFKIEGDVIDADRITKRMEGAARKIAKESITDAVRMAEKTRKYGMF